MKNAFACVTIVLLANLCGFADEPQDKSVAPKRPPLAIRDLNPALDGQTVTVKFTVAKLEPVTQKVIPGQGPTFIIEPKSEHDKKSLSVWIEGELASVLDRLQMSVYQANPIPTGTVIIASGKLVIHQDRKDGELYILQVKKWQTFRIAARDETE